MIRILLALATGGYASIALAHLLVPALRPAFGPDAPLAAVAGAPLVLFLAAVILVLLTRPARGS